MHWCPETIGSAVSTFDILTKPQFWLSFSKVTELVLCCSNIQFISNGRWRIHFPFAVKSNESHSNCYDRMHIGRLVHWNNAKLFICALNSNLKGKKQQTKWNLFPQQCLTKLTLYNFLLSPNERKCNLAQQQLAQNSKEKDMKYAIC